MNQFLFDLVEIFWDTKIICFVNHRFLLGLIFYRKGEKGKDKKGNPIMYDLENRINFALFPGLQGKFYICIWNTFTWKSIEFNYVLIFSLIPYKILCQVHWLIYLEGMNCFHKNLDFSPSFQTFQVAPTTMPSEVWLWPCSKPNPRSSTSTRSRCWPMPSPWPRSCWSVTTL